MTYTAAQMMEFALQEIGRLTGMTTNKTHLCLTCQKLYGMDIPMGLAEANIHRDRYPKHKISEEKDFKPKEKTSGKSER